MAPSLVPTRFLETRLVSLGDESSNLRNECASALRQTKKHTGSLIHHSAFA